MGISYCKKINADGSLLHLLTYDFIPKITDPLVTEISKDEYDALLSEMMQKEGIIDQLYRGAIAISDIRAEWQEEIQHRVDKMVAQMGAYDTNEISDEEALNIILGVSE